MSYNDNYTQSYFGYPAYYSVYDQCNTPTVVNTVSSPCSPCPQVTYINNIATANAVPSGGAIIPIGTTIPKFSTAIPPGTVTVINGFTVNNQTNAGGILYNNGFFKLPITGNYFINVNICFESVATVAPTDMRAVYIYKVDSTTNIVSIIAVDTRPPVAGNPTCICIATEDNMLGGDRFFIAVRQLNSTTGVINTIPAVGRLTISRLC